MGALGQGQLSNRKCLGGVENGRSEIGAVNLRVSEYMGGYRVTLNN